jgi:hypothetical protein
LLLATLLRYLAPPLFLPLTTTIRVILAGVQLVRTSAIGRVHLLVPARHVTQGRIYTLTLHPVYVGWALIIR